MQHVGVVGGGTMGAGIAEVCATAGSDVVILETERGYAEAAYQRVEASLDRAVIKGRTSRAQADSAIARVRVTVDIEQFGDRELVIEAAPEIESIKHAIFRDLDEVVRPTAILATNTSSIPVIRIAKGTLHPERVVGLHFFNPVPIMPLVEVISTLLTSAETSQLVIDYTNSVLGKTPVRAGDQSGFIVNALLIPYLCQAVRMLDSAYATIEDIDTAMVGGCGYPMGPLRLLDTIGLDVALSAAESLYAEFAETHYAPPARLRRMVDAGRLGKKVGRGFYEYP